MGLYLSFVPSMLRQAQHDMQSFIRPYRTELGYSSFATSKRRTNLPAGRQGKLTAVRSTSWNRRPVAELRELVLQKAELRTPRSS
jgi:hypothetical protein